MSLMAALFDCLNTGISFGDAALRGFLSVPLDEACRAARMLFIEVAEVLPIREAGRDVLTAWRLSVWLLLPLPTASGCPTARLLAICACRVERRASLRSRAWQEALKSIRYRSFFSFRTK